MSDLPGSLRSQAAPADKERLKASLSHLWEIYQQIAQVADEVSTRRCPYKNRDDRCTARFGCRNQSRTGVSGELPICIGSDKLDYRNAWET